MTTRPRIVDIMMQRAADAAAYSGVSQASVPTLANARTRVPRGQDSIWADLPPRLARGSSPPPLLAPLLPAPIESEVAELANRIAWQTDLPAAMRVLQRGLLRLTDSPDAMCILFDPALGSVVAAPDGNAPRAINEHVQALVARVASTGQRAFLGRALLEPIGPAPARAVIVVRRHSTGAAYGPLEIGVVSAIASSLASIVGNFLTERVREARDSKSPLRAEAIAALRRVRAALGRAIATPKPWLKWSYLPLIGFALSLILGAVLARAPAYSPGVASRERAATVAPRVTPTIAPLVGVVAARASNDPSNLIIRFQVPRDLRRDVATGTIVELTIVGVDRPLLASVTAVSSDLEAPHEFAVAEADIVDASAARDVQIGTLGDVRIVDSIARR